MGNCWRSIPTAMASEGSTLLIRTGRNVRRVSGPGFAAVPSWSPDGRRLAFVRAENGKPRVWNIWTVDVAYRDAHCESPSPRRPALGGSMVSRRGSHRLQPRGSPDRPHAAGEGRPRLQISDPRTPGPHPRRLAGRQANHFPGPPRRRVDPRPGDRVRCLECWRIRLPRSSPGRPTASAWPTIAADRAAGASG